MAKHTYRNTSLPLQSIFLSIRDPVSRMISQFVMERDLNVVVGSQEAFDIMRRSPKFDRFSMYQTLLILPETKKNVSLLSDPTELKRIACETISKVAWVGLTGQFDCSVCLLHSMYEFSPHPKEHFNMRPAKLVGFNESEIGELIRKNATLLDDFIFDCAKARFERDVLSLAPHCC